MTEPGDDLEQHFRAALPETDAGECPPADAYWAAAAGQLPFERVRALVDHGARCAQCAEAWRILADVRRAAMDSGSGMPARARLRPRSFLPIALSAVAAVGLWFVFRPAPPRMTPVERGTGGAPTLNAESPSVQRAGEAVLRWSEVPGATSYNVTVLTPDLVVVHQAVGVSGRELKLPGGVAGRSPGGGLLWNVDAVLPDGRTVASPTFELQLK